MRKKDFFTLLAQLATLTLKQKALLVAALYPSEPPRVQPADIVDKEFSSRKICPKCGSESIYKWGIVSGLQRYRCKECGRTFNALTGTSMAHLRKKELWEKYSQALADSLSLTKAAEFCGVHRTTAFRWRHRFLSDSTSKNIQCTGITEIDETYFRESGKGRKVSHREARKRGNASVRGLSSEQVAVVIAKDRAGHVCGGVLKERTAMDVAIHLSSRISEESVLCIDRSRILIKFARECGFAFEAIQAKRRKGRDKVFHIQSVNAYHSRLKNWMKRFNGVATSRLPNYLTWRQLHEMGLISGEHWFQAIIQGKINNKRN